MSQSRGLTIWEKRAEALLLQAAGVVHDGINDALPIISAAQTTLRIAYGEIAEIEMDGFPFPGEDDPS